MEDKICQEIKDISTHLDSSFFDDFNFLPMIQGNFENKLNIKIKLIRDHFLSWVEENGFDLTSRELWKSQELLGIISLTHYLCGLAVDSKNPISNSVMAICCLYAICDGYMDDPSVSLKNKNQFAISVGDRIQSGYDSSQVDSRVDISRMDSSRVESRAFKIFSVIERDFCRTKNQHIYQTLKQLHQLQIRSVELQRISSNVNREDIENYQDLQLMKGIVTNKLVYLLSGFSKSSEDLMKRYLEIGGLSQMLDDLMDLDSDLEEGNMTYPLMILRNSVGDRFLDLWVNQILNLVNRLLNKEDELSCRNWVTFLIFCYVCKNPHLFSIDYFAIFNQRIKDSWIFEKIDIKRDFKKMMNQFKSGHVDKIMIQQKWTDYWNNILEK